MSRIGPEKVFATTVKRTSSILQKSPFRLRKLFYLTEKLKKPTRVIRISFFSVDRTKRETLETASISFIAAENYQRAILKSIGRKWGQN